LAGLVEPADDGVPGPPSTSVHLGVWHVDYRGMTDSQGDERTVGDDTASRMLLVVGGALVLGFCCAMVAALYPGLGPVWTAHGAVAAVRVVHHRGAWEIGNWTFGVGIGLTLAGLVVLTRILGRGSIGSDLPAVARALATAGTAVWIVDLTYRLTATVVSPTPSSGTRPYRAGTTTSQRGRMTGCLLPPLFYSAPRCSSSACALRRQPPFPVGPVGSPASPALS
jgi:hypothetical protein